MEPEQYKLVLESGEERTITAQSHDLAGEHDFVSFYNQPEGGDVVYTVCRYKVEEIVPISGGTSNVEEHL